MNIEDINMNKLQAIVPGTVFRNRREFCDHLEVPYVSAGKTSQRQKERLDYVCSYASKGHKIEVNEVYPEEVVVANYEMASSGQGKLIESMILKLIKANIEDGNEERLVVSSNSLIAGLALANAKYFQYCFKGEKALVKNLELDDAYTDVVGKWLSSTRSSFQYTIRTALKNLSSRRLIDVGVAYKLKDSITKATRVATRAEHETILTIENKALRSLDLSDMREVYSNQKVHQFTKLTNDMSKEELGADFFFKCYEITFARKALTNLLSEDSWEENQLSMNKMMVDRLARNIQNKHDRNCNKDEGFNNITASQTKIMEDRLLEHLIKIFNLEDDLGAAFYEVLPIEGEE